MDYYILTFYLFVYFYEYKLNICDNKLVGFRYFVMMFLVMHIKSRIEEKYNH